MSSVFLRSDNFKEYISDFNFGKIIQCSQPFFSLRLYKFSFKKKKLSELYYLVDWKAFKLLEKIWIALNMYRLLQEYSGFLQILVYLELSGSTKRDKYIVISGITIFVCFFFTLAMRNLKETQTK